jgi:hypothetical protein
MSRRKDFVICLVLVCLLAAFHVQFKTAKIFAHPTWDDRDDVGQFWSEFAFHYRFAKFFAEHPLADWGQLARDRDVQHPDTINDWAEFTVAMEVPAGVLYRWLAVPLPFHVWIVWYACVVSSLSLFAVFLLARALWRHDLAGLCAAVLYATLYPSYGRTVKNLFLREDFALPLILFALWATVRMWQEDTSVRRQSAAALLWLAALASWHLTQFVLTVGVAAAVCVCLTQGVTPRRPWFVVTLAVGAVLVPVLWAKQFYLSVPMCALYALAFAARVSQTRGRVGFLFAGIMAGLLAASFLLRQSYSEYAHVYQLFWYKLRFLGVKPSNPADLPWEARCLWEGAFNTASAIDFWRSLGLGVPLAVLAAWPVRRLPPVTQVFVLFTALLVPLAWMILRYFTFLAPAVAVLAAGLVTWSGRWQLALLVALVAQAVQLDHNPLPRQQPTPADYRPVVAWLTAHTPRNAVVLASISESPVFWAHTGRPMILHSKFENQAIRDRYREFLDAIYGTESDLFAFCYRHRAEYLVFDSGFLLNSTESRRYKANQLAPLPATCIATRLALSPPGLRHFRLEFTDRRFAVFRILP